MRVNTPAQQRRKLFLMFVLVAFALLVVGPAAAAGGIEKVDKTMEMISLALRSVGIVVATIALTWGGYKMQYQGASLADLAPKFGGMLLAGSASAIAGFVMS